MFSDKRALTWQRFEGKNEGLPLLSKDREEDEKSMAAEVIDPHNEVV